MIGDSAHGGGGRGTWETRWSAESNGKRRLNNEGLPEKLTQLRQKPHRKAAEEPAFRFYALYDRIYRPDVLMAAYQRVRGKRGAAGVDGITFSKIEEREGGVSLFLAAFWQ